jgi:hypothetical protein
VARYRDEFPPLVESKRAFAEAAPAARWQDFYADRIIGRFGGQVAPSPRRALLP